MLTKVYINFKSYFEKIINISKNKNCLKRKSNKKKNYFVKSILHRF